MSSPAAEGLVLVVTWLGTTLLALANGGVAFPFVFATTKLRLRAERRSVHLTGVDPIAMVWLAPLLGVVPALGFWQAGALGLLVGGALALAGGCGCRLRIHVTPGRTQVTRQFAFIVPWSSRAYPHVPRVFADGWGDFADPLALILEIEGAARPIELGWEGRGTPSCDALAADIQQAITALPPA